ncbi:RNA helicase aquarius-like, partial [Brachionichthys hirsutus]
NLAEAEYSVALYMYMRLLGYPADRISILTTYNGQKHLIRDVINQRCAGNPFFSQPNKVTTVDRFQGQQNDYIILSLVRTKAVGHLRDVRRLVVAMSRARLGLYIFARVSLFQNCFELTPAFNQLTARSLQLHIRPHEYYSQEQPRDASGQPDQIIKNMPEIANLVYNMYMNMIQTSQKYRQQQQQKIAPPPKPSGNEKEPVSSQDQEPQEETPMEQDAPEGETISEPNSEEAGEMKDDEKTSDHAKMPEHPGRDSDSDGDDKGGEKDL